MQRLVSRIPPRNIAGHGELPRGNASRASGVLYETSIAIHAEVGDNSERETLYTSPLDSQEKSIEREREREREHKGSEHEWLDNEYAKETQN